MYATITVGIAHINLLIYSLVKIWLSGILSQKKMLEIIDDCAEMGVKAITFSGGGEPFVYKYMEDAVKEAYRARH